ncbi:MAG: flagellar protein FlaG [Pseudomonadota bacterium]|jgi:flagellar protein FlaG|nr:flagellar protein FlaG [Caulobacteraceae bacterium]
MEPRVAAVAATNSVAFERSLPRARFEERTTPRVEPKSDQPDLRLIIEENEGLGSYVYKTVDRRTGEVVSQIPREEVLKMRDSADYQSGDVVDTKA